MQLNCNVWCICIILVLNPTVAAVQVFVQPFRPDAVMKMSCVLWGHFNNGSRGGGWLLTAAPCSLMVGGSEGARGPGPGEGPLTPRGLRGTVRMNRDEASSDGWLTVTFCTWHLLLCRINQSQQLYCWTPLAQTLKLMLSRPLVKWCQHPEPQWVNISWTNKHLLRNI